MRYFTLPQILLFMFYSRFGSRFFGDTILEVIKICMLCPSGRVGTGCDFWPEYTSMINFSCFFLSLKQGAAPWKRSWRREPTNIIWKDHIRKPFCKLTVILLFTITLSFFHGPDHDRKKSLPEHWKSINNRVDHQHKSRWLLIHHHIHVPPLCNVTQSTEFLNLESRMKKKGCGIYIISILRDPMSQCISSMGENLIDPGYATTYATQYGPSSMGWFFEFGKKSFVENMRTPRQSVQSGI